ncbi:MAG: ATP-binding cassette domain-containing protein, partial [Lachnospiraceae bacterium]|nr:ATP-binding cassette domain-containing protein [Lachnospiraceae bacterium]
MAYIEFQDVKKIYKTGDVEVHALDGADFLIEKGELCVILGQSGAGKTTLLNILGGMDTLTSGTVLLDGQKISSLREKELANYRRVDVGFVFQFYNLIPNLTAIENVEMASQLVSDPMDPDAILEDVGLSDRKKNFPAQLSG